MKKFLFPLVASLISVFLISLQHSNNIFQQAEEEIDVESAVAKNLIQLKVVSNGNYSGNSLICSITNKSDKKISIVFPAGTYFKAPNEDEQNLVMPEDQQILVEKGMTKKLTVNGYCTNAFKSAPKQEGVFKLAKHSIKDLNGILPLFKGKKFSKDVLQAAIWCLTDNKAVSNVYSDDEKSVEELKKKLFTLTKQKPTWYSSPQVTTVDERRNINSETVSINGQLKYDAKAGTKIHEEIHTSSGTMLFKMKEKEVKLTAPMEYEFNLSVKGWEKGKYQVKVFEGTRLIKAFDFEV
jgi:hypothetical protein